MKKILLLTIVLSIVVMACRHTDKKANHLLYKNKLLPQFFSINTNKDTTLSTAHGAFIIIPRGALLNNNGSETVQLEIREAYSMQQIIMAGLTTQSNGRPLSSGGMIYINAAGGQSIKITKALSIKIPTSSIDKNMKLFKGDTDKLGKMNWVESDSLPKNSQTAAFDNGRALFINNCTQCHGIGKDGTGPDLAHIFARTTDKKLLYAYTRNSQEVKRYGEYPYYRCLYEEWGKTPMTLFPALTDQNLDDLYGYIENESRIRNLPFAKDKISDCIDSCVLYRQLKEKLENQKEKLSSEKIKMLIEKIVPPAPSPDTTGPPVKISPENNQSLYYQFKIEGFGWYNIDIFLTDANAVESSLMVRIQGAYKQNINLYLAIPSAKVFTPGGLLDGKEDVYGFYTIDGKIYLPQNIKAYIIAFGEFEDKIIFSKKEFSTAPSQQFDMDLSTVTKEFFNSSIKNLSLSDMQFSVNDTQNADTLRKIIKELKDVEKIKPQCNCNCGFEPPASDSSAARE